MTYMETYIKEIVSKYQFLRKLYVPREAAFSAAVSLVARDHVDIVNDMAKKGMRPLDYFAIEEPSDDDSSNG